MRAFTTEEQSKKLVEFGVDVSTADIVLSKNEIISNNHIKELFEEKPNLLFNDYTPLWTLSGLINLMPGSFYKPTYFNEGYKYYRLTISRHVLGEFEKEPKVQEDWFYVAYEDYHRIVLSNSQTNVFKTKYYKEPIDAAFEMVCKLINLGYIKVNK